MHKIVRHWNDTWGADGSGADGADDAPAAAAPPRRGGGPPGGTSLLAGGRLRTPATAARTTVAFTPLDEVVAPTAEPSTPVGGGQRSFPGGRARLPRLGDPADGPQVTFVATAFAPDRNASTADDGPTSAFEEYFTYESLFEPTAPLAEPLTRRRDDDPYDVLGVTPETEWRDVVKRHRTLVKQHHPDHLVDADPATRAAAEERLRSINLAYRELERERREATGS